MLSDISSSFRNILKGLVYPVCVASCKGSDLTNHAITVSSVTSVSFEPASLLVCINSDSSMSNAIDEEVKLNISFLHSSQKNIAELCSNPASKIRRFDNSYWDFDLNANPYIKDAQGVAFCFIDKIINHGTHQVLILNLENVLTKEAAPSPLLYGNQSYLEKFTF